LKERASPTLNEATRRRRAGPAADDQERDAETVCHLMLFPTFAEGIIEPL